MSSYHRAKREAAIQPTPKNIDISIGSTYDSFESLQSMCNDKAKELLKTVQLNDGEEMEVQFWTKDIHDLIGIAKIVKNKSGLLSYYLNFNESTL